MALRDRRLGFRVPFELCLNQYVADRPMRVMACNLSETGIYLNAIAMNANRLVDGTTVALEFDLPGMSETVWARGQVCYRHDDAYFCGTGVRFSAMPRRYAKLIREYCIESRREHLSGLLAKIRAI